MRGVQGGGPQGREVPRFEVGGVTDILDLGGGEEVGGWHGGCKVGGGDIVVVWVIVGGTRWGLIVKVCGDGEVEAEILAFCSGDVVMSMRSCEARKTALVLDEVSQCFLI